MSGGLQRIYGISVSEDTVCMPIDIVILDFRRVSKVIFVFLCHMLGHEDTGMMDVIHVK